MHGTMVYISSSLMKIYADLAHLNIIAEMAHLSRTVLGWAAEMRGRRGGSLRATRIFYRP